MRTLIHMLRQPQKYIGNFVYTYRRQVSILTAIFLAVLIFVAVICSAPSDFPRGKIIRISKDMTVTQAASVLKEKGIIRYSFVYKTFAVMMREGRGIQAGSYLFAEPQSALRIAYRLSYGVNDLQKIKVTIPEGSSSKNIANIIKKNISAFDVDSFLISAKSFEGYLFPETYYFNPDIEPGEVIDAMHEQFDKQTAILNSAISTSTHSFDDIIIMASILEEEANNTVDRRMIAGVLWNRISIGMPLQVDAPFYYLFGKGSSQLTRTDLATTSKYNTYINKGLPPGAISNPGIDAIEAALYPTQNKYLYYMADRNGVTHFAVTHDEHVANKAKYYP